MEELAVPDLDIDRYAQDMKALAQAVTNVNPANAGRRVQNVASTATVTVRVISGTNEVTLVLAESGLYIKGFTNAHGTYYFKADPAPVGGTMLSFGCSYIGTKSLGIYEDATVKTTARSKISIDQAIRDLSAFAGGTDNALKVPLAILVMLVSESIRFTVVYDRMVEVCKGAGRTYTFADFQKWVQAWKSISEGTLPAGTSQAHLFTWYS